MLSISTLSISAAVGDRPNEGPEAGEAMTWQAVEQSSALSVTKSNGRSQQTGRVSESWITSA
ncbi:MAG: hypothetical protein SNJ81_00080 [Cyanobacteriota bacterium]